MEQPFPLEATWLNSAGVARMLSITVRQWRERVACRPDAPTAHKRPGVGLRWNAAEVDAWMRGEGAPAAAGRPRKHGNDSARAS